MNDSERQDGDSAGVQNFTPTSMASRLGMPQEILLNILIELAQAGDAPPPLYTALSLPYLPCTRPSHGLQDTKLAQLELGSHNRGKYVRVQRIGLLIRGHTSTVCGVMDGDHDGALLEVTCTDPSYEERFLLYGVELIITEPFVTTGRDVPWCIKLDHPTDLHKTTATPLPSSLRSDEKKALDLKQLGNVFYKQRQFGDAAKTYEKALRALPIICQLALEMYRNLSQTLLCLGFWERARVHAELVLKMHTPPNIKALFRSASASYALQDYVCAKERLEILLEHDSQNEAGRALLLKVYKRLSEEQGVYDFDDMLNNTTAQSPHIDAASFTNRTAVSQSTGKGNGLFAAEDLGIGDLVLCEKAFAANFTVDSAKGPVRTYDSSRELYSAIPAALWTEAVQKMVKNPSLGSRLLGLGGNWTGLEAEIVRIGAGRDAIRVIDVFQVHDIVARNSFGIPTPSPSAKTDSWGLYTAQSGTDSGTNLTPRNSAIFCHAAYINHSCISNVEKRFIGDVIIIRATRPIGKGDELLLDYAPGEFHDVRTRSQGFERTWQFACDCELCTAESKQTDEVLDRRIALIKKVNRLSEELSRHIPASVHWEAEISRLEGLAGELRSTYSLLEPRKALAYTYTTLALLYGARKDFPSHLQAIGKAFESLGWVSPFETGGTLVTKPGSATVLDLNVPQLLYMACSAATATGDVSTADEIKKVEPKVYLAVNGTMNGFKGIDERMGGKS